MSDPYWLRQLRSSTALNLHDLELWNLAFAPGLPLVERAPLDAGRAVAKMLTVGEGDHALLKYRFKPGQRVVTLAEARSRGFGACADGSAAIAAAIVIAGGECFYCYEKAPEVPSYAHMRIVCEGVALDAYPDASYDVQRCTARELVSRETLRWTADAADEMRSRLVALRTLGGR